MKNKFSIFYILVLFSLIFTACNLNVSDENLLDKPGIEYKNNQITVIIPKISSETKYVNVYRQETKSGEILNLGLMYQPAALVNDSKTFCFIDEIAFQNTNYKYRARYYNGKSYTWTAWSDTVNFETSSFALDSSKTIKYKTSAKFEYDSSNYSIKLNSNDEPVAPTFPSFKKTSSTTPENPTAYKIMLIVSKVDTTKNESDASRYDEKQLFEISDITQSIALRSILPLSYMDTKISIRGIVGQQIEYVATKDSNGKDIEEQNLVVKMIRWTAPTDIEVVLSGTSKKATEITVKSQSSSEGLDYSGKTEKKS